MKYTRAITLCAGLALAQQAFASSIIVPPPPVESETRSILSLPPDRGGTPSVVFLPALQGSMSVAGEPAAGSLQWAATTQVDPEAGSAGATFISASVIALGEPVSPPADATIKVSATP